MNEQSNNAEIRLRLLQLQQLKLPELMEKWKLLFHREPPQHGEVFMRRRLAHRIQELACRGLDGKTKSKLESVNTKVKRAHSGLRLGTAIVRTWHGTRLPFPGALPGQSGSGHHRGHCQRHGAACSHTGKAEKRHPG